MPADGSTSGIGGGVAIHDHRALKTSGSVNVVDVEKVFLSREGAAIRALEKTNLDIRAGEFVSVVGPSGCGKSTLLRIICGLIAPSSGAVWVGGEIVSKPRSDVGVVFQNPVLLPWLNVMDNILMPVRLKRRIGKEQIERAQGLVEMAGLRGFDKKYPFELSGGMKQRVAICRALIVRPAFLAMDEPFGALDAMTRENMDLELMGICRETKATVLFITHSVPESVLLADRVVVMTARPGRIADIIDIDINRPRSLSDFKSEKFYDYTAKIRQHLGAETLT